MAAGIINLQKESGGIVKISPVEAEEEYKRRCLEVKAKYPKELV